MILQPRKKQIIELTEFIANDFSESNITLLEAIAKSEDLYYYFDNYEDAFDGMLLYDNKDFHIHINIDLGNTETSKRGRFTFAHELGHFFLDEHRLGLKYGLLEPHASFHNKNQNSKIEEEANYFASCILMPQKKIHSHLRRNKFSLDTLIDLSESFQVSLQATLIRFGEVGTHSIFAVFSKKNIFEWFVISNDFPKWKPKYKRGDTIPETNKELGIREIDIEDWFIPSSNDTRLNKRVYEQCFLSDYYVISLIWFD